MFFFNEKMGITLKSTAQKCLTHNLKGGKMGDKE